MKEFESTQLLFCPNEIEAVLNSGHLCLQGMVVLSGTVVRKDQEPEKSQGIDVKENKKKHL